MAGPKGETPEICSRCGRTPVKGNEFNCYTIKRENGLIVWYPLCVKCKLEMNKKAP